MSEPLNKTLYARVVAEAKKKFLKWPSAYASGWVVRTYKKRGGLYAGGDERPLRRWYEEEWIDVCAYVKNKEIRPCGRSKAKMEDYPYCRPRKRVSARTPATMDELIEKEGIEELKARCKKKKSDPLTRIVKKK